MKKYSTLQTIASKIAKLEAGKSQAKIGDIREILRHLIEQSALHDLSEGNDDKASMIDSLVKLSADKVVKIKNKKPKKK